MFRIFRNFRKKWKKRFRFGFVSNSPLRDNGKKLIENRCGSCGHLMFKSAGLSGVIEKKCEKCGNVNTIKIQPEGRPYQERLALSQK